MSLQVCAAGSSSVPCPSRLTPDVVDHDARALARPCSARTRARCHDPTRSRPPPVRPGSPCCSLLVRSLASWSTAAVAVPVSFSSPSWFAADSSSSTVPPSPVAAGSRPVTGRRERQGLPRPHLLREPHVDLPDRLRPEPVLDHPGHEPRGEHPVAEHRRVPDLGRDRVVVVHRVEVAAGAGVADEVGAAEVLDHERRRPRRRRRGRRIGGRPGAGGAGSTRLLERRAGSGRRRHYPSARKGDIGCQLPPSLPGCRAVARTLAAAPPPGAAGPGAAHDAAAPRRRGRGVRRRGATTPPGSTTS